MNESYQLFFTDKKVYIYSRRYENAETVQSWRVTDGCGWRDSEKTCNVYCHIEF